MYLTADYHTHTKYSDGKNTVLENALRARELGLKAIAITEHGFSHIACGLRRKKIEQYKSDIALARKEAEIPVYMGIEGNICGRSGESDLSEEDLLNFDLYLCGFHPFVHHEKLHDFFNAWRGCLRYHLHFKPTKRLVREMTVAYCRAIEKNPIDVLTHLNFRCFADAVEVAKCCRDYGTYVEISGKKPHLTDEELNAVAQTGVKFILNSDAHSVNRIGDIQIALEQIARVGIPLSQIENIDGREPSFRLASYKQAKL